jgi:sec-independent protein translocase protein TatA
MFLTIFSGGHVIIVLAVILLLFGGKKIPELMKGLGQGIKEFKNASKGEDKPEPAEKSSDTKIEEK